MKVKTIGDDKKSSVPMASKNQADHSCFVSPILFKMNPCLKAILCFIHALELIFIVVSGFWIYVTGALLKIINEYYSKIDLPYLHMILAVIEFVAIGLAIGIFLYFFVQFTILSAGIKNGHPGVIAKWIKGRLFLTLIMTWIAGMMTYYMGLQAVVTIITVILVAYMFASALAMAYFAKKISDEDDTSDEVSLDV